MSYLNPKPSNYTAISRRLFATLLILALVLTVSVRGMTQTSQPSKGAVLSSQSAASAQRQTLEGTGTGEGAFDSTMAGRRAKMMNNDRRKSLVADSDRLIKLTSDLNNQIAHSNSGSLTPDQVRMVAEIEKLAHNVREKMTMTVPPPSGNLFPINGSPYIQ